MRGPAYEYFLGLARGHLDEPEAEARRRWLHADSFGRLLAGNVTLVAVLGLPAAMGVG